MKKYASINAAPRPRFIDVLSASIIVLWLCCVAFLFLITVFTPVTLIQALVYSIVLFFIVSTTTFIIAGVISAPFWIICKQFGLINNTSSGITGAATGLIIGLFLVFFFPTNFSGETIATSTESLVPLLTLSALGGMSAWVGFYLITKW